MIIDESLIPKGFYCYELKEIIQGKLRIELCKYYTKLSPNLNRCEVMKIEDDFLLDDHVKICGIKDEFDDD